ncbi:MAG: UvrD-helicase domain-containing protein [Deltaproteobacteria bacterium]|nr:UvrD-helicase domain-containing protein [Deltaproteobacteria bacterium]
MLDLETLNREQREAVLTTEGPLLVLAGAGSGKTRVITYRLAKLIQDGIKPRQILAVTFTNKAAWEMRVRARNLVGKSLRGATLSTFHALGVRILRDHVEQAGLRAGFTITDAGDQVGTIRRILRDLRIDDRKFDAKRILSAISRAKNAGLDAGAFRERIEELSIPELKDDDYRLAAIECYARYERSLRAQNVVDFDDLLLLTQRLLERDAEVLEKLRRRWHFLMIDEYQDTNGAQLTLMRLLAGDRQNLCVVGDDDQSIYGWRGADIENILRFGQHFPKAKVIKLETNYRSTGNILAVANAIIEQNTRRHDKRLRPAADLGSKVRVVAADDEEAEAAMIAEAINDLSAGGAVPSEIAVLFRSNVQSRPVELALRTAGIAYRVVGGMDLFERREIRDLLGYLRLLDNPDDEQSLRRIINYPPRGIGDGSLEKIDDWARERGLPLQDGLAQVYEIEGVSPKAADAITTFLALMDEHRKLLRRRKIGTVARKLVEAIAIESALLGSSDSPSVSARRVDNVRDILKLIDRYEERKKSERARNAVLTAPPPTEVDGVEVDLGPADDDEPLEEATLTGFLGDLALGARDEGGSRKDRDDQVLLSTIHAAKGLEWKHVFLIGVEEELMPHARTVDVDGEVEEERRLAYVAVTRARQRLTASWARSRTRYGRIVPRERSRFLEGLPEDAVEYYDGEVKEARTVEEKEEIAQSYMAQIRARLGLE